MFVFLLAVCPSVLTRVFNAGLQDPANCQRKRLRYLLSKAAKTEFGRKHDFSGLLRERDLISAYQKRIPLAMDDYLRPDLDRMLRQEPDVLWPGVFEFGACSGGTTSHGKYFPVSPEKVKDHHHFGLATTISYMAETGDRSILKGKILGISGMLQAHPDYPGTLVGEASSVMSHFAAGKRGNKSPKWLAFPPALAEGLSWDDKLTKMADHTIDQDVRMLALTARGMVLLKRVLERYHHLHGRRIQTISEVWPNLKFVIAGGAPLSSYRAQLNAILGLPEVTLRETYASTQGVLAIQNSNKDTALSLWVNGGTFYEFVPWEHFQQPNAPRHTLANVQPDVLYVPYQTTCSGLWSYCLGDIVRFISVLPPQLLVVGRTSEMLDSVGEGVMRDQIDTSLEFASRTTGAIVGEYHVAPHHAQQNRDYGHQVIIEFEQEPLNLGAFAEAFDASLQQINSRYALFRTQRNFSPPDIVSVPGGTFERWLENSREEIHSQTKVPRIRPDRVMADALIPKTV